MYGSVARGAAAAAIVFLVAGGGWRIYSHVQPVPAAGIVAMPSAAAPTGTPFSNANATHRPDTVVGPVLTHPVTPVPEVNVVEKMPAQPNKIPNQVYKPKGKKLPSHPVTAPMQ